MIFDIILKNGHIVDGTGKPHQTLDVGISGTRINALGRLDRAEALVTIDATGQVVCPGFIDVHSHADFSLPQGPTVDSLVHQGITTVLTGQCGISSAPLMPDTRREVIRTQDSELYPQPWQEWSDFESYLNYLNRLCPSVNIMPLVGHGTVRAAVMSYVADAANSIQMDRMKALVVKSIDAGALGVSTGLAYAPGSFASTDELIAFTQPVGAQNRFYFSHIRNEDEGVTDAVAEAILIGRKTNAAVQISHLKAAWPDNWDKAVQCLELIDAARDDGIDVAADVYPYQAASQRLVSLMPLWSREGGQQAILKRFASKPIQREVEISMKSESPACFIKWDRIMVCGSPKRPDYQGRYIDELATEAGKAPFEWVCDALVETELDLMIIMFISSETNVELIMQHPAVMIGTDGTGVAPDTPLYSANVHPRNYGTFAKALGHYVREKKLCRLEEMIRKMTGQAAERFHLTGRGFIRRGNFADVVVFDPERVVDMATFENPHQYPHGICHVIVNGQFVIKDGEHTQKRPGHILRF